MFVDLKYGLLFALLSPFASAQEATLGSAHPLFQDADVLKAVLTAPIAQTYAQRHQEARLYFPGQWTYVDADGQTQRLEVSIRTRGHFRREYCDQPPLQLNFKKKQVKGTLFAGQDKLKLVAPCKQDNRHQQYVILEYLAYKIFEIVTDNSFKVRLVRLSYVDRDEKIEPWTSFGFVIEDDSDLAKRQNLDKIRVPEVKYAQLDQTQMVHVQLFQLLIANTDASLIKPTGDDDCCHNVQILRPIDSDTVRVPVPFDFDMSGFVNARYAAPPAQIPIRDVRQRYFYGLCQPDEVFDAGIAHIQSKRAQIEALIANEELLSDNHRSSSLKYVSSFYEILDDPKRVKREIVERCRGRKIMEDILEEAKNPT
jgi:hypothetical protein